MSATNNPTTGKQPQSGDGAGWVKSRNGDYWYRGRCMVERSFVVPGTWTASLPGRPCLRDKDGGITHFPAREDAQAAVDREIADSLKRAAALDLYEALEAQTAIITHAQAILAEYLPPDGMSKDCAIDMLLELLDGPDQREAQAATDAALAKARGDIPVERAIDPLTRSFAEDAEVER